MYSYDSDFSNKSEELYNFFKNRGYPDSVVNTTHYRDQQNYRESALQTSNKEKNERIPFTLTSHPYNLVVEIIILKSFKSFFLITKKVESFHTPTDFFPWEKHRKFCS